MNLLDYEYYPTYQPEKLLFAATQCISSTLRSTDDILERLFVCPFLHRNSNFSKNKFKNKM